MSTRLAIIAAKNTAPARETGAPGNRFGSCNRGAGDCVPSPEQVVSSISNQHNMQIGKRELGSAKHTILIVDNFFEDPDAVRNAALKLRYTSEVPAYPGVTASPDWECSAFVSVLSNFVGCHLDIHDVAVRLSMVTKRGSELEPWQCIPHFDEANLAGVVYLNPSDQCRGGTAFYRHRASGLEEMPSRVDVKLALLMMRHGIRTPQELFQWVMSPPEGPTGYITESTADWELVDLVEMKYNRLVMYNGRLFHSGYLNEGDFDQTMAGRRLTLNCLVYNQGLLLQTTDPTREENRHGEQAC